MENKRRITVQTIAPGFEFPLSLLWQHGGYMPASKEDGDTILGLIPGYDHGSSGNHDKIVTLFRYGPKLDEYERARWVLEHWQVLNDEPANEPSVPQDRNQTFRALLLGGLRAKEEAKRRSEDVLQDFEDGNFASTDGDGELEVLLSLGKITKEGESVASGMQLVCMAWMKHDEEAFLEFTKERGDEVLMMIARLQSQPHSFDAEMADL